MYEVIVNGSILFPHYCNYLHYINYWPIKMQLADNKSNGSYEPSNHSFYTWMLVINRLSKICECTNCSVTKICDIFLPIPKLHPPIMCLRCKPKCTVACITIATCSQGFPDWWTTSWKKVIHQWLNRSLRALKTVNFGGWLYGMVSYAVVW